MCKASLWAKHHEMARTGVAYGVGISDHGLPALHPVGQDPKDCITCVPDKTVLTLTKIPAKLRQKYGLGESTVATFVDTGDNKADMLRLNGAKDVQLAEFANVGIVAHVGVEPGTIVEDEQAIGRKRQLAPVAR